MNEKEPFLSRWSRRKLATKEAPPAGAENMAEPHPAAAPPAPAGEPVAAEAQAPATPEYREYFDPKVDEGVRRTALKKLFSEPQFNVMDGLDTYIDDYSKPDPIPEAMLRQMNQAKDLLLFDDEKEAGEGAPGATPVAPVDGTSAEGAPAAAADASALPEPPASDASDEAAGAATNAAAAPARESVKNR